MLHRVLFYLADIKIWFFFFFFWFLKVKFILCCVFEWVLKQLGSGKLHNEERSWVVSPSDVFYHFGTSGLSVAVATGVTHPLGSSSLPMLFCMCYLRKSYIHTYFVFDFVILVWNNWFSCESMHGGSLTLWIITQDMYDKKWILKVGNRFRCWICY